MLSNDPLLVAAYTDELDCVAILQFPGELVAEYRLQPGTKLLTVNMYRRKPEIDADLIPGPNAGSAWSGFNPLIADFVSDDAEGLKARKKEITKEEWVRCYQLGREYIKSRPGVAHDGRPVHVGQPADFQG